MRRLRGDAMKPGLGFLYGSNMNEALSGRDFMYSASMYM